MRRTDPIPNEEDEEVDDGPALDPSSAGKDDDLLDDYPRPDPSARASEGPELQLADEGDHPLALDVESESEG